MENKLTRQQTEAKAKVRSLQLSREKSGKYILPAYCFGWMPHILNQLSVHSAGDSAFNWYALNGKIKQFTEKQIVANQNACIGRD